MLSTVILILFFCSGATALVYEVIWSKYLALLLGSTIQAQTVVLAVFMGGLALGNKLFSRSADLARHPLTIYGGIEIAIGLYAFLFSFFYRTADAIFASVGSTLLDQPGWLSLLKCVLSMALLLGPTLLMGGTFPVLAAWLQKNTSDAGRRSARFYSINTFGAVCGASLAGFWLIESLGLRTTMDASAAVNVIIGLIAIFIGKTQPTPAQVNSRPEKEHQSTPPQAPASAGIFRQACIIVALTGAVSMGLEVLASRCLCLIFGASLQVFAIVLMAFIFGIGAGSAVIASPCHKPWRVETAAIFLLLGAALFIGLVVYNIENLAAVYFAAQSHLSRDPAGYRNYRILVAGVSISVLGLPAAALGSVLPLSIRAASETSELLGERVGRLLTWNTLGAVGGSLSTGFVLMPQIGLRGSFIALGLVLVLAAILAAMAARQPLVMAACAAGILFVILVALRDDEGWRYIFSAGIFSQSDPDLTPARILDRRNFVHLDFYEDAADATVSVERGLTGTEDLRLRIDGKIDASAKADKPTQLLLAYLPLMAKPESRDVFCFGMGSGVTAGATLNYPIEHLTVAENCGPVLRAAKLFDPWNNGVLTNNRTRIYHEDARTVLKLSPRQYDVIISEPSNPWMAGVASVFTREFYQLAANRLKPGGIMAQWFHTYEMDDRTVDVVLRTFESVFPNMEIWDVVDGDIIILGSAKPWRSDPEVYRQAFALATPRNGLTSIGLETPEAVLARRMASQRTAFAIPDAGPIQADDFSILEYSAPRAFYIYLHNRGVFRLQNFDERTWQTDLAPAGVNNDLAKLDPPALKTIFANGGSLNGDLISYLQNRYSHYLGHADLKPILFENRVMPCTFLNTNGTSEAASTSDAATNYADAVRASLRLSEPGRAGAMLLRGLQSEPDSDELRYLSRILIREKILQPADLAQAGIK